MAHRIEPLGRTLLFRGDRLLKVSERKEEATTHALATVQVDYDPCERALRKMSGGRSIGTGMYACFFEGKLFYVGIFAGNGAQKVGNVADERWRKHVGGMTLRGLRVTISKRAIAKIAAEATRGELGEAILKTDLGVMSKDQGLQTTYGKYRFAQRNWAHFRNLSNETLRRFQFVYIPCDASHRFGLLDKKTLKKHLEHVEAKVVGRFEPPCNSKSRRTDGVTEHGIRPVVRAMREALKNHIVAASAAR